MKNYLSKFCCLIVILVYLLTPLATWAQTASENDYWSNYDFTQGDNVGTNANPPQPADQRLQNQRQPDQQKCELESSAQSALNKLQGLANPESLQNILQEGLGGGLQDSISKIWTDKIPGIIEREISQRLPRMVEDGLRRQLPALISGQLNQRALGGASASDLRSAFPTMVAEGIQTLLPQIITQSLQQLVPEALEENLPTEALIEIESLVPEIINASIIPGRVNEVVASTTSAFPSLTSISQAEIDAAANTAISDINRYTIEGIADSNGFSQLINDLVQGMSQQITPLLNRMLSASSVSQFSSYSGGNWSAQSLDSLFNIGTGGILGGFSIEQNFFNPIMTDIGNNLTLSTVNGIRDWQIGNVMAGQDLTNLTFDQYVAANPSAFNGIPGANNANVSEVFNETRNAQIMDGIQSGAYVESTDIPQMAESMGVGGQNGVLNNTASIGNNAAGNFSWSGLGTDLKASFASGLGDMVGGLIAGNVPFVGGLLGSLTDQLITEALGQVMGLGTGGTAGGIGTATAGVAKSALGIWAITGGAIGIATAVLGNTLATTLGFLSANMSLSQISGYTQTSNQNEKTMIKQDNQRNNVLVQACTYEKSTNRVMLALEKLFYIIQPDASKARYLALVERTKTFFVFMSRGYRASGTPGDPQANGQSFVRSYEQTINERTTEQEKKAVHQTKTAQSGNWAGDQVAQKMASINQGGAPKQSATQEQWEKMRDPAKTTELTDEEWNEYLTKLYTPGESPATLFMLTLGKQEASKASVAALTKAELNANGGVPSGRVCESWVEDGDEGYCEKWKTTVPGRTLLDLVKEYSAGLIAFFTNNNNVGSDFVNKANNPLDQITNLAANPQTNPVAQTTGAVGSDPCPDPEGCQSSGWRAGQVNTQAIGNALEEGIDYGFDALNNLGNGGSGDENGGSGFQLPDLNDLLENLGDSDITINENLIDISLSQRTIARTEKTETTISWSAANATMCFANNDWLTGDLASSTVGIRTDDVVETTGQIVLRYPNQTTVNQNYGITCYDNNGNAKEKIVTVKNNE